MLMAAKVPSCAALALDAVNAQGMCVVVGLQSTGEANTTAVSAGGLGGCAAHARTGAHAMTAGVVHMPHVWHTGHWQAQHMRMHSLLCTPPPPHPNTPPIPPHSLHTPHNAPHARAHAHARRRVTLRAARTWTTWCPRRAW
jgi:hypothetical protein